MAYLTILVKHLLTFYRLFSFPFVTLRHKRKLNFFAPETSCERVCKSSFNCMLYLLCFIFRSSHSLCSMRELIVSNLFSVNWYNMAYSFQIVAQLGIVLTSS